MRGVQVVSQDELQCVLSRLELQLRFRLAQPEVHDLIGGWQRQIERRHIGFRDVDEHMVVAGVGKLYSGWRNPDPPQPEPHGHW